MWTEKKSITLSKISVWVFLGLLLAVDIGGYWLVKWFVGFSRYGVIMSAPYPALFLISLYAASVFGYVLLFSLNRLLQNIEQGEVFIHQNVVMLRRCSWCCVAAAIVCLLSCLYYLPFFLVAVAAAFMALVIRVIKNVFEQAIAMKADLDLTI